MNYQFLNHIASPDDVKKLNIEQLGVLCDELRDCILETVSQNGGHLASNLGSVELTVALHKVFDSPTDSIVFDVGHQCYPHKLLTGRFNSFNTLRKPDGISGFVRPEESEHDTLISGHSSTSISSAEGFSIANELLGLKGYSIAVIGDGALTGGMAYEAIINARKKDKHLIVILNDNKMSISKSRSALAKHLSTIRTRKKYHKFKMGVEKFLVKIPLIGHSLRSFVFKVKNMLKNSIYDSNIFEALGFYYMGPIDGHNLTTLIDMLEIAKDENRPVLLHIKTQKGKGFALAENDPNVYHGVSNFDKALGVDSPKADSFSAVFGRKICEIAERDNTVCAITAAMPDGTGLKEFSARFKNRFFDVGIAEQHAVTFSAALAKKGLKPVFAVYSTFLQRAYDQIIHDAAIEGLPLTLAVDRAGFVGEDGETHQGLFDVAFLSSIPGVKIFAPSNYDELEKMLEIRLSDPKGVAAIRYPRGKQAENCHDTHYIGQEFNICGDGNSAIVCYGSLFDTVLAAAKELESVGRSIAVVKLNEITELSDNLINSLLEYERIFFFEEAVFKGSVSEALGCLLLCNGFNGEYYPHAVNGFVKQNTANNQRREFGLDLDSILTEINEVI
ncbi:MAG: 1-deoxy-D-xylulose-5-phosphate synthase [Ruminococcaceae bacterium]|nr:1-deoxy-D-xylulose-5-phosphate synthase [Oscillospiraceae bacterium]